MPDGLCDAGCCVLCAADQRALLDDPAHQPTPLHGSDRATATALPGSGKSLMSRTLRLVGERELNGFFDRQRTPLGPGGISGRAELGPRSP